MWLWLVSFVFISAGLSTLWKNALPSLLSLSGKPERLSAELADDLLIELIECIEGGIVPSEEQWGRFSRLPSPWGDVAAASVLRMRAQGRPILPTLQRLRHLAKDQIEFIREGNVQTSQALMQAILCTVMVPMLACFVWWMFPEVAQRGPSWWILGAIAMTWSLIGVYWVFSMADRARWGGLSLSNRKWIVSARTASESVLAAVRSGTPADIAWLDACNELRSSTPLLAARWGTQVWTDDSVREKTSGAEKLISELGGQLRGSIQVSLLEGTPSLERIETSINAFSADLKSLIFSELKVLPTKCLKPLFFFVSPAVFGLLLGAVFFVQEISV